MADEPTTYETRDEQKAQEEIRRALRGENFRMRPSSAYSLGQIQAPKPKRVVSSTGYLRSSVPRAINNTADLLSVLSGSTRDAAHVQQHLTSQVAALAGQWADKKQIAAWLTPALHEPPHTYCLVHDMKPVDLRSVYPFMLSITPGRTLIRLRLRIMGRRIIIPLLGIAPRVKTGFVSMCSCAGHVVYK